MTPTYRHNMSEEAQYPEPDGPVGCKSISHPYLGRLRCIARYFMAFHARLDNSTDDLKLALICQSICQVVGKTEGRGR